MRDVDVSTVEERPGSRSVPSTPLSKAATKMLAHLRGGKHYPWRTSKHTPRAMLELEKAGLVTTVGRVVTIERCWVSTEGYVPFVPEVLPGQSDPSVDRVLRRQAELLGTLRMTPATREKVKAALRTLFVTMTHKLEKTNENV
jgi:hypothetical protein